MKKILRRTLTLLLLVPSFLGLSGCAGHRELTAPCSFSHSIFSASAFAASHECGPLIRLNQ